MEAFQQKLLKWYKEHKRDLPWRNTTDPYTILVSEIMLQQTQVDRVIPKFLAFLDAFPTPQALAEAKPSQVITLWSGLGYNSRAIRLQQAAQKIVERDGLFPRTPDGLQALPGIGPYTSRAVLSFAFNENEAVIDTNVRRVFSRLFCKGAGTTNEIDVLVRKALPHGKARLWNNALMDFGSMLCSASKPKCDSCFMKDACTAYAAGTQENYLKIAPPQKKFKGSRRWYRGKVLKLLKDAPNHTLPMGSVVKSLEKSQEFVMGIVKELEKDKLVVHKKNSVSLP